MTQAERFERLVREVIELSENNGGVDLGTVMARVQEIAQLDDLALALRVAEQLLQMGEANGVLERHQKDGPSDEELNAMTADERLHPGDHGHEVHQAGIYRQPDHLSEEPLVPSVPQRRRGRHSGDHCHGT